MEIEKKVIKNVYVTKDYDKFSMLQENRLLRLGHVANIEESMKKKFLFNPIIVNEKLQIIDGQHRFTAVKNLNKPLLFMVNEGYGINEVIVFNTHQKDWDLGQFHRKYLIGGSPNYLTLEKFRIRFNLSLNTALLIIQDSWRGRSQDRVLFKSGKFVFTNRSEAEQIAKRLTQIRHHWTFSASRGFVTAFKEINKNPCLDWSRLLQQSENYHFVMEKKATKEDYCRAFQSLYNYNRSKRESIYDEKL